MDITFNLNNSTYRPYKTPNNSLLYINRSSNHPPQIINHFPNSFGSMNIYLEIPPMKKFSTNINIDTKKRFVALRTHFKLKFNKTSNNHTKRKRQRNIIWFNMLFNRAVSTNVGKRFLQLLRHLFPHSRKLHRTFNKNTVQVSYCCTQNVASIIKSHNKELINTSIKTLCHVIAGRSMSVP